MAKGRFALAIAVLAGVIGLSGGDTQAQESVRPEHCTRELARSTLETLDMGDVGLQRAVAETCGNVGATARGVQAARARFYAGRAYNRIPGESAEAVRQLEIAVNAGQDFEAQFRRELRAARLELAQAYRSNGRIEAARNVLANTSLRPGDPAVAYQRALLILAELGSAGQESAFDTLKTVFVQDDAQLRGAPDDPTGLTSLEIRRGRSWLYALGMTLGQRALHLQARDAAQRRSDALRATDYFRPVTQAINAACPDPQPLACANGIGGTEQIGAIAYPAPRPAELSNAFFQLGVAYLKAAGLQETSGLSGIGVNNPGEAGGLDCFASQTAPDAAGHFQLAGSAFETVIGRSAADAQSAADAHWGLACTILGNIANVRDPSQQRAAAVRELSQALSLAPNQPLTVLTLARAYALQGELGLALANYTRALAMAGPDAQCQRGREPDPNNRAELPSRIYLEMAQSRYARQISTRPGSEAGADLFRRTITDVRNADPNSLREAEGDLLCAISLNFNNTEARLTLGHIYLRLGSEGALDPPPFVKAHRVLQYFEPCRTADRSCRNRLAGGAAEGRAEGLYLLSRRQTLIEQQFLLTRGTRGNWEQAVAFATQAYNSTQRSQYRRQACLAQLLFRRTLEEGYCSAAGEGEERTEALLYEGMYWLRRGEGERGTNRNRSWARAIQAFNRGLAESSSGTMIETVHPSLPGTLDLRELLQYGQRYVLRCARLNYVEIDPETATPEVRAFFKLSGMPDPCGGG